MTFRFYSQHGMTIGAMMAVILIVMALSSGAQSTDRPKAAGAATSDSIDAQMERAVEPCKTIPGVDNARCLGKAELAVHRKAGTPYMDLIELRVAYRIALMQQVEDGLITLPNASVKYLELKSRGIQEGIRRDALAEQQRLASFYAFQTILDGFATWQPIAPAPRFNVTCQRAGDLVNCF